MSNKYIIIYSPLAADDLRSIYTYITNTLKAKLAATNQVNAIRKAIRALDIMPERFPIYESKSLKAITFHKLPVNNYVIFYMVDNENHIVNIVRIFYGGMDIDNALQDKI